MSAEQECAREQLLVLIGRYYPDILQSYRDGEAQFTAKERRAWVPDLETAVSRVECDALEVVHVIADAIETGQIQTGRKLMEIIVRIKKFSREMLVTINEFFALQKLDPDESVVEAAAAHQCRLDDLDCATSWCQFLHRFMVEVSSRAVGEPT